MTPDQVQDYASQLSDLARQLNAFAATLKTHRQDSKSQTKRVGESPVEYENTLPNDVLIPLISEGELQWLGTMVNI